MRTSGVLLHISSLPSPYGIGTLGACARDFIDFLNNSAQSYWQVLPVSPTGFGDSPYQSFSSFAGNPYFIDLDELCSCGYLREEEFKNIDWGENEERVNYGLLYEQRPRVLKLAAQRFLASPPDDFGAWCDANAFWLESYALFMALKAANGGAAWMSWEHAQKFCDSEALSRAALAYVEDIACCKAVQYLFFSQWKRLREYAHENGIRIIGDLPIYVSPDSAELWSTPHWFRLDDKLTPIEVAGCPPDGFTPDGQLWGNPLYDWGCMREDGFSWWIRRIAHQFEIYDVLRLDHFRGFDAYYAIPHGDETARNGRWRQGPGIDFFSTVNYALGKREYIAEDLGFLTPSVTKLLEDSGLPGMKVLQFAFDSSEDSEYLPHNYIRHCAVYTGTHDNDTILGWFENAPLETRDRAVRYLRIHEGESRAKAMMSALLASAGELAVITAQDILELGSDARMNTPSVSCGNWQWRMKKGALNKEHVNWLREQTTLYGRAKQNI